MCWSCKNLTLRCNNEGKKHYKQTCNIDPLAAFLLLRNHLSYRLMFPKQHAIKHWNVCVIFCPQVGLTLCQVRLSPTLWQLMLVSWPETSRSSVRIIQLWCKTRLEPGCSSAPTPGRESTIKVKKDIALKTWMLWWRRGWNSSQWWSVVVTLTEGGRGNVSV